MNKAGITPAYAGNTGFFIPYLSSYWDHPRLRGEHLCKHKMVSPVLGSPPPTRGTHAEFDEADLKVGITPAYAGNTL